MDEQNIDQPAVTPAPTPQPSQPQPLKHNTLMAVVAYILFFIPLLTDAKNDPFVKFHVKQGLVLFLACLASAVLVRLPVVGFMLMFPLNIFIFILWIMGIVNALNGKQERLPIIGKYADKFQF